MTPFWEYVEGVVSGKVVAGKLMRLAVERFIRDRDKADYLFDEKEGGRIVTFAEKFCRHWKGPKRGKPIILEPHQHFYWMQKFGWVNPETGLLRFRRSAKMIARKQYKTTEAAIESLFHMLKGVDQPAQVFTCATKEDDAVVVVNDAGRIAMVSPKLKDQFKVSIHEPYVRRIICGNGSFMTYMTKGHDAVDISMGIGDECHDWPDASIKNRIESAMGNRISPMFSTITTSGFDKNGYCFSTLRDTGIKILEGIVEDEEQLVVIFEMDESDDWKDEEKWNKPNPNLDYSLTHLPYLRSEFKKALNEGGSTEVNFKTKNLNMWVDSPVTFIPTEIWDKNAKGGDDNDLNGGHCYVGIEIGPSGAASAVCFLFPGETVRVKMFFFLAEKTLSDNEFFGKNSGCFMVDAGNEVDNELAVRWILDEFSKYEVHSFCFPNTQKNNSVIQDLIKEGYEGNPITLGPQGIGNPTDEWEKLLRSEQVEHYGNPVLRWMNSNCVAVRKEVGTKIEKNPNVIGIYACVYAVAQWKTIAGQEIEVDTSFTEL